jgi:hypothetical protein
MRYVPCGHSVMPINSQRVWDRMKARFRVLASVMHCLRVDFPITVLLDQIIGERRLPERLAAGTLVSPSDRGQGAVRP